MSRPLHYSPAIKRHLVTELYYEAKRQGCPMTHLTNGIIERGLRDLKSQRPAEHGAEGMVLNENPPSSRLPR